MIRNSPVGLSPLLIVAIGDVPVNYTSLMSISVDLQENQHDLCKIVMSGIPSRSIPDYIGKNVFVQMSTGATFLTTFYGTVERPKPTATTAGGLVNNSLFQEVEFSCLGCSYSMRGSNSHDWSNRTLVEVAKVMADRYGFSLDVPADGLIFPNMKQTIESDWQFLVRYANAMGYSVTVHGTHLHIFDPFKAKGRQISLHRVSAPGTAPIAPTPGQIVKFDANMAQRASDGKYMDSSITILGDNGKAYDVHTSDIAGLPPATYSNKGVVVVDNYAQAQRSIAASYRSQYDYRASVITIGDAGMYPGGLANVDGYGSGFDGLWYVFGVRHDVRSGSFLSYMDLRQNRSDTLSDVSAAQFRTPPPPQSIGGSWTTTSRVVNAY